MQFFPIRIILYFAALIMEETTQKKGVKAWLKKLGVAGFLFFLIKGLMWIAAFYFGLRFTGCES